MLDLASSVVCRRSTSFLRDVACAERVPAEKRAMNSLSCAIFFSRCGVFRFDAGTNRSLGDDHVVVAAVVHNDGLIVDVGHVRADAVEKMAVVRNDDQHALVLAQIILEPVNGIEVEVVGGLVEQQHLRMPEERLGEQDANFLSALQFAHFAFVQRFFEAEAIEKDRGVGFGGVAVFVADDSFEFAHAHAVFVGELVVRFRVQGFAFLQGFPQTAIAHDHGVDHAMFVEGELILAQDAEFFRPRDVALGGFELAGEDLHERGFAGAVGAGDGVAAAGEKGGGDVLEQYSGAEPHRDVVYCEQRSPIIP